MTQVSKREQSTAQISLWRGMKSRKVSEEFWSDLRGGTELAPMTTTPDIRVAAQYGVRLR